MDWNRSANIAEIHIERVPFAVRIEGLFVESVCPRSDEGNAAQRRPRLEFFNRSVGPAKDILPLDLHRERDVANSRQNGYHGLILRVFQQNRFAASSSGILLCRG